MARVIFEAVGIFFTPFLAYAAYLFLRQQLPFTREAWTRATLALLSIVGLALTAVLVFGLALLTDHSEGAYVPAHVENGRLVPGSFK